jgi:hypothetical protein
MNTESTQTPESLGSPLSSAVRAFSVTVTSWIPECETIVPATTAAKAKYSTWKAAHDAGYKTVKFGDLRVRRSPEFDCIADKLKWGVDRTHALLLKQNNIYSYDREKCDPDSGT